jgi:dipeptidyl aminopeptidase/acylaminoacyl peptidase
MNSATPRRIAAVLIVAVPALLVAAAGGVDSVSFSTPSAVADLDMGKLKGEPTRLAWSPDGTQFYLQTTENAGRPNARVRHYILSAENGAKKDAQVEPEWAASYWLDKSAQTSPDDRTFRIEAKAEQRTQRTTSTPMGGEMARGGVSGGDPGTGSSSSDGVAAAYGQQTAAVNLMLLKGEVIGEFVNSVIVPGLTFGWAPKGTKLIAYAVPKGGRVVVMDETGQKKEVAGSKEALLPAWSPDAKRLAWVQREGRRKFSIQAVGVEIS